MSPVAWWWYLVMSSAQGAWGQENVLHYCRVLQSAACCRRKAAVKRAAALLPLQGPARCREVPATSSTTAAHHMIRGLSIKLSQAPVTVIAISVFAGRGDGGEANK